MVPSTDRSDYNSSIPISRMFMPTNLSVGQLGGKRKPSQGGALELQGDDR